MSRNFSFPPGFVWGTATAAAQIEGAAELDGKGPSIWDHFAAQAGRTQDGGTPATACDHYHLHAADFALMRELGIGHYRFSIAWPRLFPSGRGPVNPAGMEYYQRLIDCMLEHGITPWCTLYHWDLPQALEDEGGWRDRRITRDFEHYAVTAVKAFGDRVKNWFTLNEIPAFVGHGYKLGLHAPGAKEPAGVINQIYHHALVCHGLAVRAVRDHGGPAARVGLVHNPEILVPCMETEADITAARTLFAHTNEHVLAPLYQGAYPEAYLNRCGPDAPWIAEGDMELIGQRTDFLGLNVYRGHFVRRGADGLPELLPLPDGFPRSSAPWLHHVPQAAYWAPRFCQELYGNPLLYIAENGIAYPDAPGMPGHLESIHGWSAQRTPVEGEILDLHRCQYLRTYLQEVHRAITDGVPVAGYFLWSLLDNFEWADGYVSRFGITHVDFATQRRRPKLSAHWYGEVIRANRVL